MKTVVFILGVCILTCTILYFSLYKKVSYNMQLINNTDVEFIEVFADFKLPNKGCSLTVGEASSIYTVNYQETILNFFGSGRIMVGVKKYINKKGQLVTNTIGKSIGRHRLSEDKLNVITFYGKPDGYGFNIKHTIKSN